MLVCTVVKAKEHVVEVRVTTVVGVLNFRVPIEHISDSFIDGLTANLVHFFQPYNLLHNIIETILL